MLPAQPSGQASVTHQEDSWLRATTLKNRSCVECRRRCFSIELKSHKPAVIKSAFLPAAAGQMTFCDFAAMKKCWLFLSKTSFFVGSPLRGPISNAIIKLNEQGYIQNLKKKWWENERGGGTCMVISFWKMIPLNSRIFFYRPKKDPDLECLR